MLPPALLEKTARSKVNVKFELRLIPKAPSAGFVALRFRVLGQLENPQHGCLALFNFGAKTNGSVA